MSCRSGFRFPRSALAAACLLLTAHPALAQSDAVITLPEEERDAPQDARKGRVLEEIVVTAQKVEQSLRDVPVAVSVVSGDTLRDSGVFGPEGLENFVPNVELDVDAQAPTIGVRGFSTDGYNVGLEPSVGIIVDEIPIGRTEFIPDGLFDIGRVEVLRGPQGTLFGKNTIAGVLIFGTRDPDYEPGGTALFTLGEHGGRRIEAATDLPAGESLITRLAAVGWRDPGEVDNSFLGRRELELDQNAARFKTIWDASEALRFRVGTQYSKSETSYSPWQLYETDEDALDYARSKDPDTEDDPFNARTSFDLPGFVNRVTNVTHAIAEYDLSDDIRIMAIAGHAGLDLDLLMDFDVSAADLVNVFSFFDYKQDSFELRATGSTTLFGRRAEFVGGLFGLRGDLAIEVDVALGDDISEFGGTAAGQEALGSPSGAPLPPLPAPGMPNEDGLNQTFVQDAVASAAFGQLTWYLTHQLSLTAGLRFGSEEKDAVLMVVTRPMPAEASVTAQITGAENFTRQLSRSERETSPKLGLRYEFNDDWSTYFNWTRGFKGGGFNAISFSDETEQRPLSFEPEQGDNFELGLKSRLAGGSMQLNATVYHTDVTNMQVVNFNGISFDVFNAAEAQLQGFEADLTWLTPWEWLELNASLSVSTAEYTDYTNAPPTAEQQRACDDEGTSPCFQDLTGRTLPKAPTSTLAFNPTVSLPLGGDIGLRWGIDISHRGDQYLELDLDPRARQAAHTVIGSHISIGPLHERWGVTVRGENLTDEKALAFVSDHNLYANSYFAAQIPLRGFSISFMASW